MHKSGDAICQMGEQITALSDRQTDGVQAGWLVDQHTSIRAVDLAGWLVGYRMDRRVERLAAGKQKSRHS